MSLDIEEQRKAVSAKLKQIRIERGYSSYEKFATEHFLGRKQYWRMEENQTNMTLLSLLRILKIHELTLEEFFKEL